jgi:2-oxoglutarate dehydrogenase E2 component (dihydrolipoamide succinyltransferase)
MSVELKIPDVGESIREVQIGRWLKREGDSVGQDENVVELETDKASMELPAPAAGVIGKILKREGEVVGVGEVVGYIETDGAAKKDAAPPKEIKSGKKSETQPAPVDDTQAKSEAEPAAATKQKNEKPAEPVPVTPAARRALRDYGLTATDIESKGPRIHRRDVLRYVEEHKTKPESRADQAQPDGGNETATKAPKDEGKTNKLTKAESKKRPSATEGMLEEVVPMSLIRRRIAERLVEAQQNAALLTTFNEIDMSAVKQLRETHRDNFQKKYGVKLGFMSFFVKATVDALREQPELNAEIRGDQIVYRHYHHIGIAIGSAKGLVVPVLRFAERLSFAEIEQTIDDFSRRAAENKLGPQELEGGTFTITNGGVFGSLLSTPIVNPPQSGVLGMHSIQDRPVARDGQVVIRPMMYVALTYDHRIVDGREAVTFLKRIKDAIEDPARLLLEV